MAIRPVPLADATPDQLRAYARNFMQLDLAPNASDDSVLSAVKQAQPGVAQIFINEADTPVEIAASETAEVELRREEATGKQAGSLGRGDPRAIITIPVIETEDNSGAADVTVGVNGRAWQLKRGVELPVPWRVVEALQNAEANVIRHSMEEGAEGDVIERKANRFNISFTQRPSQAEIDAWVERTGAEFCA